MKTFPYRLAVVSIIIALALVLGAAGPCVPPPYTDIQNVHLLLSHEDTSSKMMVHYHSNERAKESWVYYDTEPRDGKIKEYRKSKAGSFRKIPSIDRKFHSIELTGLKPDTIYYFVVGDEGAGHSSEKKFKTLPKADDAGARPIRIAIGGDMDATVDALRVSEQIAKRNPDVVMVGGDIAYGNGELDSWSDWRKWFVVWKAAVVSAKNFEVPGVIAIGNHETNKKEGDAATRAPFYFGLFNQGVGDRAYFARTFPHGMAMLALDSGHIDTHDGPQLTWLKDHLEKYKDWKHLWALYHIPFYPSYRSFETEKSVLGRKHWAPLFDQFKLGFAFENHDHAYKRTHPINDGKIVDPGEGTVYLGDGCWGKKTRPVEKSRWYLNKAEGLHHFWQVDLSPQGAAFKAIGRKGDRFDQFNSWDLESLR